LGIAEGGLVGCPILAQCLCPLLHKTAVISWLRLIKRKAKYEALKKRIKKKGRDGNK